MKKNNHRDRISSFFENLIDEVFVENRKFFLYEILETLDESQVPRGLPGREKEETLEWVPIGSLSAFRKEVGGRLQKLKERWESAGLPLKEHRGTKLKKPQLKKKGWKDLELWLEENGYQVKLSEDKTVLLEIRKKDSI